MASPGTFEFYLDNGPSNSAGLRGYYSPGHTNVRTGFSRGIGVKATINGVDKWRGLVKDITPDPFRHGKQRTKIKAEDWIAEAADLLPAGLLTQTSKTADELATTALATVTRQPPATDFATGSVTFAFAFDEVVSGQTTLYEILSSIAESERAYIYEKGDGTLVIENANSRLNSTDNLISIQDTGSSDDYDDVEISYSERELDNYILGTVYPRVVDTDATATLWSYTGDPISIGAGLSVTLEGFYSDSDAPGQTIGGTGVLVPSSDEWTWDGSDSDLGIAAVIGGSSTKLTLTNNDGSAHNLSAIKILGKRVRVYQPFLVEAYDSDSVDDDGEHKLPLNFTYLDDINQGQSNVANVLAAWKTVRTRAKRVTFYLNRSASLMNAFVNGDIGRKITLVETQAAVSKTFWINGVGFSLDRGRLAQGTWYLSEANETAYFLIDHSSIDGADLIR